MFGHGDLFNAFSLVDLLETAGYEGPRHFDYKPSRTEDITGVWTSAAANMRTYLLLKERAAAFRADPEVQAALKASRVDQLAIPTLGEGETLDQLRAETSFDPDSAGKRSMSYGRLDQLGLEHLMGVRT